MTVKKCAITSMRQGPILVPMTSYYPLVRVSEAATHYSHPMILPVCAAPHHRLQEREYDYVCSFE
jgi:hypothetical protein